jgi:formamidopyrimidine-DNA glycosylase
MPELPEVETTCRGLAKQLVGRTLTGCTIRRAGLRIAFPARLAEAVSGQQVVAITRRAKYIVIELGNDQALLLHLGMSGRLLVQFDAAYDPLKHDHLVLDFDGGRVVFNDPRRFGLCDLVPVAELPQHRLLKNLGIEPLGKELTADWLWQKLRAKKTSIKAALLDQRLIVGIGNIYACEALFHAGIKPTKRADQCTRAQIDKLVPAIKQVLTAAIKAGGSSLRDYVHSDGKLGYFQNNFAVYDREGQGCPGCTCNIKQTGGIQRVPQGGRSSFWCARKQS